MPIVVLPTMENRDTNSQCIRKVSLRSLSRTVTMVMMDLLNPTKQANIKAAPKPIHTQSHSLRLQYIITLSTIPTATRTILTMHYLLMVIHTPPSLVTDLRLSPPRTLRPQTTQLTWWLLNSAARTMIWGLSTLGSGSRRA